MTSFTSVVYKFKQAILHEELENYINQSSSLWPFLTFRYEGCHKKKGDLYYAVIEDCSKSAVLPQNFEVSRCVTKCGGHQLSHLPPHRLVKLSNNEQRYVNTCASHLHFTVKGKKNSRKLTKYLEDTYPNASVTTCVVQSESQKTTQYTVQFSNNTKDAVKVFEEAFKYIGCLRRTITFTNGVESLLNQISGCISEHSMTGEDTESELDYTEEEEPEDLFEEVEEVEEILEGE